MAESVFLTVAQAAEVSGLHPNSIVRSIRAGRLDASKSNGKWSISRAELEFYLLSSLDRSGPKPNRFLSATE